MRTVARRDRALASYGCHARSVTVSAAPASEPITTATAKAHLQIASGNTADDTLVDGLVAAARAWVEQVTGLRLITQTLVATYDAVPALGAPLLLPVGPVQSVSSVVTYDTANTPTTLATAAYLVDIESDAPRIGLNDGYDWPSDVREINGLKVTFVAGYGAAGAVPQPIVHALLMLVAFLYDQRAAVGVDPGLTIAKMPFGPEALLAPFKVWWL